MKLAIVVGCATYEDPIPSLRFASDDARRVAGALRGACGLEPDHIWLLNEDAEGVRSHPTYTNVLRTLSRARLKGAPANVETLFFFFSGHGYHSREDGSQYLLLSDSVAEDLEHTALSVQTIVARLQEWNPRHLVLLVDACREAVTDSKGGSQEDVPGVDVNALLPAGNITFSSCSPGQRSYELQALGSGIFTQALCEALSDIGRCRTLHELNAFVQRRVPELCGLHGKPTQDPVARLEPAEVLALEIVSQRKRNEWRTSLHVGEERRRSRVLGQARHLYPVLSMDFGTCNTLAAVVDASGKMHVVPGPDGRNLIPSVVNFSSDWDYVVGADALELDLLRPNGTVWYPKRRLGSPSQFTIHEKSLPAEFVSSLILRHVQRNAEEYLGQRVRQVVTSYPASFSIAQTNALQQAFDLAGLDVVRFVPEPSASAFLGPEGSPRAIEDMLIVDLGGGTLDVAVYESSEGVIEIKATQGDGHLGGIDYDEALEELLLDRVRTRLGVEPLPPFVRAQVRREASRAKHILSSRESCEVLVSNVQDGEDGRQGDLNLRVDRGSFEEATRQLNRRLADAVMAVMRERLWQQVGSGVPSDAEVIHALRRLKHVLLCGQSTRIPSLVRTIGSLTPAPVISEFENDAVVRGLSYQLGVLRGFRKDVLLLDNMQQGIGVLVASTATEDAGPVLAYVDEANTEVLTLVGKGTTIPTLRSEIIALGEHSPDRTYLLRVVELKSLWGGSLPLGIVEFRSPSGEVDVTIDVDANAIILLTVNDRDSGQARTVVLNRRTHPGAESIVDQRLTGTLDEASHEADTGSG